MGSSGTADTAHSGTVISNSESRCVRFDRKDWLLLAFLAAIASLMFLPFLGAAGLFDPTDSFFIESGREMFETKRMIVPLMNYEPWLDKPALAFWFIVGSFRTFGVNEFAGRFPSALSGILIVLSTFILTRPLLSRRQAFYSALTLAASPLFLIVGHVALTDEPLALFLTISLLSIINFLVRKNQQFLLLGYFALSLAALCKGPLALVIVGLITIGYFLLTAPKQVVFSVLALRPLLAIAFLLVITVPYYVWTHIGTNGEFTNAFFLRQNLGRMVGVVNHVNPFWWYIPVVIGGFFPWSIIDVAAGPLLLKYFKRRGRLITARQQLMFFSICWALIGFVFFSAIPTKLQTYIVPIFPALAISTGIFIDCLLRLKKTRQFLAAQISLIVLVVAAPFLIHFLSTHSGLMTGIGYGTAAVLLVGLVAMMTFARGNSCRTLGSVYGATMIGCGVFLPLLFCLYHDKYQANIDTVVRYCQAQHAHLAAVQFEYPSLMYRYHEKIPLLKNLEDLQAYSDEPGKRWIFIPEEVLSLLSWTKRSPRVVGYCGKYWVFAIGKDALKEDTIEWNGLLPQFHYPTMAELDAKNNSRFQ
jgi:4-amino-4-deoxy-L-arabinose transferase-like glycosyltransferase